MVERHKTPFMIRKVMDNGKIYNTSFKGFEGHYLLVIPLKMKTDKEKHVLYTHCRQRTEWCKFSFLGKQCSIYTDGFTEHLRPMIPAIKDKVLNDCIENPSKLLDSIEIKEKEETENS